MRAKTQDSVPAKRTSACGRVSRRAAKAKASGAAGAKRGPTGQMQTPAELVPIQMVRNAA